MSTAFLDISAALDGHLEDIVGVLDIAWPNRIFDSALGTVYSIPTYLLGDTQP